MEATPITGSVWRHWTGGSYTVIGTSTDDGGLVYYAAHVDGSLWWRPISEFVDGRFKPLPNATPLSPREMGFSRA